MVSSTEMEPGRPSGPAWTTRQWIVGCSSLLLLLGLLLAWGPGAGLGGAARAQTGTHTGRLASVLDCPAWTVVSSPNGVGTDNQLSGTSAVSATEVWAVGFYTGTNGLAQTLTERWDGVSWTIVPSPNAGTGDNYLQAVSARATDDVWAVGQYRPTPGANLQTLILHWTGSAWSIVASPNGSGAVNNSLLGVTAVAANDAWAVGYFTTAIFPYRTLILHWNGTSWAVASSPNPGFGGALSGITAVSATDVWAVGAYASSLTAINTLIVHWTGGSWTQVTSPSSGSTSALAAVAPVAANDIWAVGVYSNTRYLPLTEHWNGAAWTIVPSPGFGTGDNGLAGVAARATNDVWA
ncbi:MAG TPA: hypothetical protein VM536_04505, partial [Chloroflexia bacterium]|nr:hypothetical protein [Chloroflexia bacterium]